MGKKQKSRNSLIFILVSSICILIYQFPFSAYVLDSSFITFQAWLGIDTLRFHCCFAAGVRLGFELMFGLFARHLCWLWFRTVAGLDCFGLDDVANFIFRWLVRLVLAHVACFRVSWELVAASFPFYRSCVSP